MTLLPILYWIVLILSIIFSFWEAAPFYLRSLPLLSLLIILGLKVFPMPLK